MNDLLIQGSIGARIEVTLLLDGAPYDATGATVTLRYRKPGGQTGAWAATLVDPAAGLARYVTPAADTLDTPGRWEVQPRIVTAAGETLYGDAVPLHVAPAIPTP
jgi:hypothetical protein